MALFTAAALSSTALRARLLLSLRASLLLLLWTCLLLRLSLLLWTCLLLHLLWARLRLSLLWTSLLLWTCLLLRLRLLTPLLLWLVRAARTIVLDGATCGCIARCLNRLRVGGMTQRLLESLTACTIGSGYGRLAVVDVGKLRAIGGSGTLMLLLHWHGVDVLFVLGYALLRGAICTYATLATVEGNTAMVFDVHLTRVDVVYAAVVDTIDGAIVGEGTVVPITTLIASAKVAVAIVHATVEADVEAPVATMPHVSTITPAPVAGCPEGSSVGRKHPCAGNPVVSAIGRIAPVAGCPDITIAGAVWLFVDRQLGRSNVNGDKDASEAGSGNRQERHKKQKITQEARSSHKYLHPVVLRSHPVELYISGVREPQGIAYLDLLQQASVQTHFIRFCCGACCCLSNRFRSILFQ